MVAIIQIITPLHSQHNPVKNKQLHQVVQVMLQVQAEKTEPDLMKEQEQLGEATYNRIHQLLFMQDKIKVLMVCHGRNCTFV